MTIIWSYLTGQTQGRNVACISASLLNGLTLQEEENINWLTIFRSHFSLQLKNLIWAQNVLRQQIVCERDIRRTEDGDWYALNTDMSPVVIFPNSHNKQ